MLKRTKIYLVLTLLVLTGFAGSLNREILSGKERKTLVNQLKESKKAFIESAEGLSKKQLDFKPSPDSWSVRECIYRLAFSEKKLWQQAEQSLKQTPLSDPHSGIKMSNQQLNVLVMNNGTQVMSVLSPATADLKFKNIEDAINDFRTHRADLIKFVKTTTDDFHSHATTMPLGVMDAYQILLLMSFHSNLYTRRIEEIKSNPGFPKH